MVTVTSAGITHTPLLSKQRLLEVTYFMVTGKAFLGTDFSFSFTSSVSSHFHNSNFKKKINIVMDILYSVRSPNSTQLCILRQ